jgi:hypothetical protein
MNCCPYIFFVLENMHRNIYLNILIYDMVVEFASGVALCVFIYLFASPMYLLPLLDSPSVMLAPRDPLVVSQTRSRGADQVDIPMELFEGQHWHTPATKSSKTLASNKYGQFQLHTVLTEQGTIAENWLWTNDRDQVNVIVRV